MMGAGSVVIMNPASVELVLVNSDPTEAAVDLTLLGPEGEIVAVGARGIALARTPTPLTPAAQRLHDYLATRARY